MASLTARVLAEEIGLGRDDDVRAPAVAAYVEAADDRDGDAVELAEHELRRPGDLVREGDPGRLQLVAVLISLAREVAHHPHPGGADRAVRQLHPLDDETREVVSLLQLRQPLDGGDGEARPDVLDEEQGRVVVTPEAVQLLERDEADRLVERAGRVVAAVRARWPERLHLEIADAPRPAPPLGLDHERPPDAAPVLLAPDTHHVDLGRPRRVLLEAEEAEVRL